MRVLKLKVRMGLFENPNTKPVIEPLGEELRKAAKETADESIVLLKNESDVLPLSDTSEKLLVVGPYVFDQDVHLGSWACKGEPETSVSVKAALAEKFQNARFLEIKPNDQIDRNQLKEICQDIDKIIVTLGEPREYSGENHNRQFLDLPFNQNELGMFSSFKKPLTFWCLGRPLAIADLAKKASGILWCWHLGVEAGSSIADVLTGEVNPSAKLTQTFPKTLGQVPIYYNRYQTGRPELLSYVDGDLEPLYPFGFGLHYGCVRYEQTETEYLAATEQLIVKVRLENEGKTPTKKSFRGLCSRYNRKLRPAKSLADFRRFA